MLNSVLKSDYFKNEKRVILPEIKEGENNREMAATVAANFAANGFSMDKESVSELASCSTEDIVGFYNEYLPIVEEQIGSDHEYRPFYPNFPEEVMKMSDLDMFFDQVLYSISGFQIKPEIFEEAKKRFPFIGEGIKHPILKGTEEDYHASMKRTMSSAIAYSKTQRDAIFHYFKYNAESVRNIPSQDVMKNHENRVVIACTLDDVNKSRYIPAVLTDATDALRYAAVKSAERDFDKESTKIRLRKSYGYEKGNDEYRDALYSYATLRFTKGDSPSLSLSRAQRKTVLNILENASKGSAKKLAGEMYSHKTEWKRLIKNLHISDSPEYTTSMEAFRMLSVNQKGINPRNALEEAIKKEDIPSILSELSRKPGEFMRRFDKVARIILKSENQKENMDTLMSAFRDASQKAGIATVYSIDAHIKQRSNKENERVFVSPSNGIITRTSDKNREPIPEWFSQTVHENILLSLEERYKGKEPMGNVYISPEMDYYRTPTELRESDSGIETFGRGSSVKLQESGFKRLFIHWTNLENKKPNRRIDLDLSATFYDESGNSIRTVSWNEDKADRLGASFVFSGDVQDGGPADGEGVAEFIDLDLQKLRENGVRYVSTSVSTYRGPSFDMQPNSKFGVMERTADNMGELFEPQAVTQEYKLVSNKTAVVPVVFDIEENRMIWIDEPYHGRIASREQSEVTAMIDHAVSKTANLQEIIEANAKANGAIVDAPELADTLFLTIDEYENMKENGFDFSEKKVVFPSDMNYITGTLMTDGPKDKEIAKEKDAQKKDAEKEKSEKEKPAANKGLNTQKLRRHRGLDDLDR